MALECRVGCFLQKIESITRLGIFQGNLNLPISFCRDDSVFVFTSQGQCGFNWICKDDVFWDTGWNLLCRARVSLSGSKLKDVSDDFASSKGERWCQLVKLPNTEFEYISVAMWGENTGKGHLIRSLTEFTGSCMICNALFKYMWKLVESGLHGYSKMLRKNEQCAWTVGVSVYFSCTDCIVGMGYGTSCSYFKVNIASHAKFFKDSFHSIFIFIFIHSEELVHKPDFVY